MSSTSSKAHRALEILLQCMALGGLNAFAEALARLLPVPVPPGAIGLVLLFALLCGGVVRLAWIERGAMLLVRHLGLFLLPYAVSFMAFEQLFRASGLDLAAVLVASTVVGMAATASVAQRLVRIETHSERALVEVRE